MQGRGLPWPQRSKAPPFRCGSVVAMRRDQSKRDRSERKRITRRSVALSFQGNVRKRPLTGGQMDAWKRPKASGAEFRPLPTYRIIDFICHLRAFSYAQLSCQSLGVLSMQNSPNREGQRVSGTPPTPNCEDRAPRRAMNVIVANLGGTDLFLEFPCQGLSVFGFVGFLTLCC
jgi:hypothetical protein